MKKILRPINEGFFGPNGITRENQHIVGISDKYKEIVFKLDHYFHPERYKFEEDELAALPELLASGYYTVKACSSYQLHALVDMAIALVGDSVNLNWIDTSGVTSMNNLFHNHAEFNGDVSGWDVSNVTDMGCMFDGCKKFNGDVSNWDVSNVENMNYMFLACEQFNCDISSWNVSNVTNMNGMFVRCGSFDCDISGWDVSSVTDMGCMFYGCGSFNRDLSRWNVQNVREIKNIFEGCPIIFKYEPSFNI